MVSDLFKVTLLLVAMLDLNSGYLIPQKDTFLILQAGSQS